MLLLHACTGVCSMYRRASQGWAADSEMCAIFFLLHVMRWALSEVIGPTKLDVLYGLARTTISLILAPSLSHTNSNLQRYPFKKHRNRSCLFQFLLASCACQKPKGETSNGLLEVKQKKQVRRGIFSFCRILFRGVYTSHI